LVERYADRETVIPLPCPRLAELVEGGDLDGCEIDTYVGELLAPYKHGEIDALVLGCTHYPLVSGHIRSLYPNLRMYSSSAEVIREAAEILKEKDMLASGSEFTDRYYASDMSDNFVAMTDRLFKDTDFKIHLLKLEE
jgi:glutamate racemase